MSDYIDIAKRISKVLVLPVATSYPPLFLAGSDLLKAEQFCHDPRVAMALMEKLIQHDNDEDSGNMEIQAWHESGKYRVMIDSDQGWVKKENNWPNESLAFTIVLACLEALENE